MEYGAGVPSGDPWEGNAHFPERECRDEPTNVYVECRARLDLVLPVGDRSFQHSRDPDLVHGGAGGLCCGHGKLLGHAECHPGDGVTYLVGADLECCGWRCLEYRYDL